MPIDNLINTDDEGKQYFYCLIGNMIDKHYYGIEKEIKSGTRHFRAGTKLYCLLTFPGMGSVYVTVIGKPRKSFQFIQIAIKSCLIKNFRVQKVYSPAIIKIASEIWDGCSYYFTEEELSGIAVEFNKSNAEIEPKD